MVAETGATTDRLLNKLAYAAYNKASDIGTIATDDRLLVADTSADGAIKYATPAQVGALRSVVSVTDAATYTVLAADSGKTHILPNFTATCTLTLPTAAAGLEYTFIAKAVATDAQNWIFAAGVPYLGGVQFEDTDEPGSGGNLTSVFPNGSSNDNMTIVTPSAGTIIYLVCDGTNWIVNGIVYSATVPTFAD